MSLPIEIFYMIATNLDFPTVLPLTKVLSLSDSFWSYYFLHRYDLQKECKLTFPLYYERWGIKYIFHNYYDLVLNYELFNLDERRHVSIFLNCGYMYSLSVSKWKDISGDLSYAVKNNSEKIVDIILTHPFLSIYDVNTALVYAVRNQNIDIVQKLLKVGISCVDVSLEEAYKIGNRKIIDCLKGVSLMSAPLGGYYKTHFLGE